MTDLTMLATVRGQVWLAGAIRTNLTGTMDALAYSLGSSDSRAPGWIEDNYEQIEWLLELSEKAGLGHPDITYRMGHIEQYGRKSEARR